MGNFRKTHGLTLAANSWVENFHVERLATDPSSTYAGRVWFNSTEKVFKMTTLDAGGSIIVRKFATMQDLLDFQTALASQTVGDSGSKKVGYDGITGVRNKFSVAAGTLDNTLDAVVTKLDDLQYQADNSSSNAAAIQAELNATQSGAGLDADGIYVANGAAHYISGALSLKNADDLMDAKLFDLQTDLTAEESARIAADALKLNKSGGVMSGNIDMSANRVTNLAEPVDPQDAATKYYVDTTAQGLDVKQSCRMATTEDLGATYNATTKTLTAVATGALVVDGMSPVVGDRVLVKDQATMSQNGIYIVTTVGDAATQFVLTRAVDFDNNPAGEINPGAFTFVETGTANADNGYVVISDYDPAVGFVLDTDNIMWQQFSGAGQIIAGAGLSKSGNEIWINMGAGIIELPGDQVGVDLFAAGGLMLTTDGVTNSTAQDAQVGIKRDGTTLTVTGNGIKISDSVMADIAGLHTELDNTQAGAGLAATGAYNANVGANYIGGAVTLKDADNKLDAALKVVETNLNTEATTRQTAVSNLQVELDATQTGAGLGTGGAYAANITAAYISGATSLFSADALLDAALKTTSNNLATEISNRQTADNAIQSEMDRVEAGAGLSANGDYIPNASANYISSAVSLHNATMLLDAQVKINTTDIAAEVSARQAAITNLKNGINAKIYKGDFAASTTHNVVHNLGTMNVDVSVWVMDTDMKWKNDLVGVIIQDNNNITVELTEAREIRCIVRSAESVA